MNSNYALVSISTLVSLSVVLLKSYPVCAMQQWHPRQKETKQTQKDNVITVSASVTSLSSPKLSRQPVPASDGADYLKNLPGFGVVSNGETFMASINKVEE